MKITKINASFSKKIQLAQYEPIEVFMAVEGELEDYDVEELPQMQNKLFEIAKRGVEEQINKLR